MTSQVYLEGFIGGTKTPQRFDMDAFPVPIGRHPDCAVVLDVPSISRRHAEIRRDGGVRLEIDDLGSTNGTFVNGKRIGTATPIFGGDVIHFGDHEFRLVEEQIFDEHHSSEGPDAMTRTALGVLPHEFPRRAREFNELLEGEMIVGHFQPIVDKNGRPFGHELLGRGTHPALESSPGPLFSLAAALDAEVPLSELMRRQGLAAASRAGLETPLFFNTHPAECRDPTHLIGELQAQRAAHPSLDLVFEVHEGAVTDLGVMAEIGAELRSMDIRLAYDDFGAGQARLQELIEVPPDFLKFDIALIRGISEANTPKYRLLSTLNAMIKDLGVCTLAEGVEDEPTARACAEIGIDLIQGYFYGYPEPLQATGTD